MVDDVWRIGAGREIAGAGDGDQGDVDLHECCALVARLEGRGGAVARGAAAEKGRQPGLEPLTASTVLRGYARVFSFF